MELLQVQNVKKIYNIKRRMQQCVALRQVSFEVGEAEFLAIMGPSGSGKTTLLNIIASLDRPTEGDILLDGRPFSGIRERELSEFRRKHLGFVFQDFNLLDNFSLKDNILLPLVLSNTPLVEMERQVALCAQMLHIEPLLNKYPYEVSGGEKQRAAVARAVITNPRLILADEPTGALDSKTSANLLGIFRTLNQCGKTILMVTHSAFAASYASRVLFIRDGEIFSQIYRGENSNQQFFERIVSNLSVLGGADVG
jgi:putative ABC transport system ATP-binding protein